jgi:hypothetical protein
MDELEISGFVNIVICIVCSEIRRRPVFGKAGAILPVRESQHLPVALYECEIWFLTVRE